METLLLLNKSDFLSDKLIPSITDDPKVDKSVREAQQFNVRPLLGDAMYYDMLKALKTATVDLAIGAVTNGPFVVGETVTADNGSTAIIKTVAVGALTLNNFSRFWGEATSITGGASTATAAITTVTLNKYTRLMDGEEYVNSKGETILFPGLRMCLKYYTYSIYIPTVQTNVTSHSAVIKTNPFSIPQEQKELLRQADESSKGAVEYWKEAECYLNANKDLFTLWKCTNAIPSSGFRINVIGGYDD